MPALPAAKATYLGHAELVTVTSDENGWEMWITTDQGTYGCNIHGVSKDLLEQTKRLQHYWDEALVAKLERNAADSRDGYDLSDPKHPDWHSVHADLWDARENK